MAAVATDRSRRIRGDRLLQLGPSASTQLPAQSRDQAPSCGLRGKQPGLWQPGASLSCQSSGGLHSGAGLGWGQGAALSLGTVQQRAPPGMQGRRLPARPSPSPAAGTFCSCPSALSSPHRHTPAIPMPQGAWRMARALFQRAKIRESIEQGEGRRRGNGLHTGVCGAAWGCQHETSQTAAIWRKQRSCWIHLRRAGYQVLPSSCLSPALLSSSTATAGETKPRHQTGMGQVTHLPFQSKAPLQGTVRSQLWCQDTSYSPVAAKLCCPSAPLLPTAPAEPSLAWGWSNTGPGVAEGPRVQYRTVCPACSQCRHKHSSSIPHSCGVQTLKT